MALASAKVAGTKSLPLLPDTAAVNFSDSDSPNGDERETSTGEAGASAAKPTSSILKVVEQQTCTAPSHEISNYLPYMNRPVLKIKRPFDRDDDGSEAYTSPFEEQIYFHRGALHHFLTHCKMKHDESRSEEVEKRTNIQLQPPQRPRQTKTKLLLPGTIMAGFVDNGTGFRRVNSTPRPCFVYN